MSDLISRQAAIDATTETVFVEYEENADKEESIIRQTKAAIRDRIKALPPVQPQQMKGRWLPDNNSAYEMRFVCSVCKESEVVPTIGFTKYKPIWYFCPNCGAKMER